MGRPTLGRAAATRSRSKTMTTTSRRAAAHAAARAGAVRSADARAGAFSACDRLGAGRGEADRDAGVSDRVGARSMDRGVGAAGGAALVRPAGGRDQADLGLFLPRHERPGRARASPSMRSATRSTSPPSCWPTAAHHREGRLARLARRAGLPARRAGRRLRSVHHGAGARLQPLPLRPHPRRPDAARQRPAHLQSGRRRRRTDRRTGAGQSDRAGLAESQRAAAAAAIRSAVDARNDPFAWRGDIRAAATRESPARSGRAGPDRPAGSRKTTTGSRTKARARRSTGPRASTRPIELLSRLRRQWRNGGCPCFALV